MPKTIHHRQTDPLTLLESGAAAMGLSLGPAALEQCRRYLQELALWNTRVNLTGLKSTGDMVTYLFLDSLALLTFLGETDSLADLGSGAGFPGLVLKLARPGIALTLVESRGKKAAFLRYLAALLGLSRVEVVETRLTPQLAGEWGPRFAGVTSRAAFDLPHFLALAAPLLRPGGLALAPKGPELPPTELQAARHLLFRLGLESLELKEYHLPNTGESRLLAAARKKG